MAEKVYYAGAAVLHFNGEDIRRGDVLPADFPAASVKSMLNNGKASTTKPEGPHRPIRKTVTELPDELAQVRAELAQANETIAVLTEQLTAAPAAPVRNRRG